jgi:hypothetical protein
LDDFKGSLAHLQAVGAVLYRGLMEIDGHLWMCQVRDPWGNCIGIRGPLAADANSARSPDQGMRLFTDPAPNPVTAVDDLGSG